MQVKDCVLIEPFICDEDESIVEVAKKLKDITLRHIFVVNTDNYPVGIISVTDMNNRVVAEGKDPNTLKAKDIMSKPDIVKFDDDVEVTAKMMIEKGRVMNPVVKDNKIIGIITIHQLMKGVKQ